MSGLKKSTSSEIEMTLAVLVWIILIGLPITYLVEFFLRCYYETETEAFFELIFGFSDILVYLAGLFLLIFIVMYKSKKENRAFNKESILMIPWLLSIIVSVITAQHKETAIVGVIWTGEGAIIFLIYLLLAYAVSIQSEKKRDITMKVLWGVFLVQFAASVLQSCFKTSLFEDYFTTLKVTAFSAMGLLYNQNALGSFSALFTGVAMGSYLFSKTKKSGFLWLVLMTLSFFMLMLSGTRGGMVGVAGMVVIASGYCVFVNKDVSKKETLKKLLWIIAGLALAVLVAACTSEAVRYMLLRVSNDVSEIKSETIKVDNLGSQRIMVWRKAWSDFLEHPLVGKGVSNFRFLKIIIEKEGEGFITSTYDSYVAHNYYLELLANQGILGLISYLFMMGGYLVLAFRSLKVSTESERMRTFSCICGVIAFMITDVFEWHIIYLTPYLYVFLGLMLPAKKASEMKNEETTISATHAE